MSNLFFSPINITYIAEISASIAHGILSKDILASNITYNLFQLISQTIPQLININEPNLSLGECLKSTNEYEQLKVLYDEYITEIVKLIKSCGNLDIIEISILHYLLLGSAIFSKNDEFEAHIFKEDCEYIHGIMWARIVAGYGVCRTLSAHLKDVLNKLN